MDVNEITTSQASAILPESNEVHEETPTKATRKARKAAKKVAKANRRRKPANQCVCGCKKLVHNLFAQGHDQRVRGMLLEAKSVDELPAALREAIAKGEIRKTLKGKANQVLIAA